MRVAEGGLTFGACEYGTIIFCYIYVHGPPCYLKGVSLRPVGSVGVSVHVVVCPIISRTSEDSDIYGVVGLQHGTILRLYCFA